MKSYRTSILDAYNDVVATETEKVINEGIEKEEEKAAPARPGILTSDYGYFDDVMGAYQQTVTEIKTTTQRQEPPKKPLSNTISEFVENEDWTIVDEETASLLTKFYSVLDEDSKARFDGSSIDAMLELAKNMFEDTDSDDDEDSDDVEKILNENNIKEMGIADLILLYMQIKNKKSKSVDNVKAELQRRGYLKNECVEEGKGTQGLMDFLDKNESDENILAMLKQISADKKMQKNLPDVKDMLMKIAKKRDLKVECDLKEGDGDAKIENEGELKEYAMATAKKIYGDDVDEKIVDDIVKNAIEKSKGDDGEVDWGAAAGIIDASYDR